MARGIYRLSARQCETAKHNPKHKKASYLPDGGSLYLRIRPDSGKSWTFRYRAKGSRVLHEVGLGGYPTVSLTEARRRADEARIEHQQGIDPINKRREADAVVRGIPIFGAMVAEYIDWRTRLPGKGRLEGSSLIEWETTLRLHTTKISSMRVDQIQPEDVAAALKAVWATNKSASRILNRVEQIFARAIALRFRSDNPATWQIQQHLLGPGAESGESHAAMPWQDVPAFMERLRAETDQVARALEFVILTAARASEVAGDRKPGRTKPPMSAAEIEGDLWVVPAERMKRGQEHRVPLSLRAQEIAGEVAGIRAHTTTFSTLLKKLGVDTTVHGFRSSFKSWAEENGYGADPRLVDFALAHSLPDKVEASYNRVTRVEEHRRLMQRWADYCAGIEGAKVVKLRKA